MRCTSSELTRVGTFIRPSSFNRRLVGWYLVKTLKVVEYSSFLSSMCSQAIQNGKEGGLAVDHNVS